MCAGSSFDELIRPNQKRLRNGQSQRLRGLQVDDKFELRGSLYGNVCDETGMVRRHVNIFVNARHMRDRSGLDTPLEAGDVVTILPAISGG